MTGLTLFGSDLITLPRLMGSNNCFSAISADVILPWNCTHTPEYSRPANSRKVRFLKKFFFLEVLMSSDDNLMESI